MMEKFLQKKGSKSKQLFLSLVVVCEVTFGDDDVIISGALKALCKISGVWETLGAY